MRNLLLLWAFGLLDPYGLLAQATERAPAVRVIVLTLTGNGLSPRELSIQPGRYLIRLRNGLLTRPVGLVIDDERGVRLQRKAGGEGAGRTELLYTFVPGKLSIGVEGDASWKTTISVSPAAAVQPAGSGSQPSVPE